MERAQDQIVTPLEKFRTSRIGGVKENKKKFDKKTAKFCKEQEMFLSMSSKKPDNTIQEVIERTAVSCVWDTPSYQLLLPLYILAHACSLSTENAS